MVDLLEVPAKWTGNGSRMAKPDKNDWYETVSELRDSSRRFKKDFSELPADYDTKSVAAHFEF
jgi:hypothetical protein